MAAINHTGTAPFGAISIYRAVSAFDGLLAALRRWNSARVTSKELRRLSGHQLEDIGVNPGDIPTFAWDLAARR